MFEVKVKTLDGQNTSFEVDDDITVAQFKQKINDKLSIPVDRQRLIFTGKVLNDTNTLKSYNVEGKVIHVVSRAPPSSMGPSSSSGQPTPSSSEAATAGRRGTQVSVSSIPSNLVGDMMNSLPGDAMVHHIDLRRNPNHTSSVLQGLTESSRRIVLIRQWIRDAHSLLDRVRYPAQGTRLSSDSLSNEAREVSQIPTGQIQTEAVSVSVSTSGHSPAPPPGVSTGSGSGSQQSSTQSVPDPSVPLLGVQGAPAVTPAVRVLVANPDVEVLSSVWHELDALNARLLPVMKRYREMLTATGGCPAHSQHLFDTISSVSHCLAHVYHAISDLTCDFQPSSSRELIARAAPAPPPTAIIQQTIPVTIPLRVAAVNMSPRPGQRNPASSTATTSTTSGGQPSRATSAGVGGGVYTHIELDMDTSDSADEGSPQVGDATQQPFNLSRLVQDMVSGLSNAGLGSAVSSVGSTSVSGTPLSSAPSGMQLPAGMGNPLAALSSLIPGFPGAAAFPGAALPGAATPANGPILLPGAPGVAGATIPQPPLISGARPTQPKDRHDPYLSSCHSRHWASPQPTQHAHSHQPPSSRANLAASQTQSATARPGPAAAAIRQTDRQTPTSSNASSSAARSATDSSNTLAPHSADNDVTNGRQRRHFFAFLLKQMTSLIRGQASRGRNVEEVSPDLSVNIQHLQKRLTEIFNHSGMNRQVASLVDLHRAIEDLLPPAADSQATSSSPLAAAGEHSGLLSELGSQIGRHIQVCQLFDMVMLNGSSFDSLRVHLRRFAKSSILQDGPSSEENIRAVVHRLMVHINEALTESLEALNVKSCNGYDVTASLSAFIGEFLVDLLKFLVGSKEGTDNYGDKLLKLLHTGLVNVIKLCRCFNDVDIHGLLNRFMMNNFRHLRILLPTFLSYINQAVLTPEFCNSCSELSSPDNNVENYLIRQEETTADASSVDQDCNSFHAGRDEVIESEVNEGMTHAACSPVSVNRQSDQEKVMSQDTPLGSTVPLSGSASDWRSIVPADWVAIIEEDIKRQLRLENEECRQQEDGEEFSEAYLSTRPHKRRRRASEQNQKE